MAVLSSFLFVRNRPGLYAIVTPEVAARIAQGHMKLFWSDQGTCVVETITRSRRPLVEFDPSVRYVFFDGKVSS